MARKKGDRKYGSAAARTKKAAAQSGPGGGGGTMFQNIPDGMEFYNPEAGKVTLRLLPYVVSDPKHPDGEMAPVDDIWYKRPFKRFRQIGTEKKPYISLKSIGKACPVMEYYAAAKADPGIPDKEANRAKPQDMVMYNVQTIDRKGNPDSEPMFFFFSYHNFEKMLKKELMDIDNEDCLTFMDLENGYDIRVRWSKETFNGNDFLVADNITFIERDDIDEDILDKVADLDSVLVTKSYGELNNIFLELDEEEGGKEESGGKEDPPAEKPKRRGRATPKEEKEPEPEKPKRGRRKSAEPEPEPEKPKRGRRSSPKEDEKPENPCPEGFVYAEDWDTKRACDGCKKFDACGDEYDKKFDSSKEKKESEKKEAKPPAKKTENKSDDNKCPHGYDFGTDCDQKKECADCVVWDSCMDKLEELEAAK